MSKDAINSVGFSVGECCTTSPSSSSSTTTSSIGNNSGLSLSSEGDGDGEETEVQSAYKETEVQSAYKETTTTSSTLDSMDSLEDSLPIRRGMSKFYNGKSKSFTSLSDAVCTSSMKDIAKPENEYSRRRRNLLASNLVWDKNRRGISKRPLTTSRSTLAFVVAMSGSESSISSGSDDSNLSSVCSRLPPNLPPLHPRSMSSHNNLASLPQSFSPWRSCSLADLQRATDACEGLISCHVCDKTED